MPKRFAVCSEAKPSGKEANGSGIPQGDIVALEDVDQQLIMKVTLIGGDSSHLC